jgi:hypothetical protein
LSERTPHRLKRKTGGGGGGGESKNFPYGRGRKKKIKKCKRVTKSWVDQMMKHSLVAR